MHENHIQRGHESIRREDNLIEVEDEIARCLGRLLGYDEATIEELLKKPRF